MLDFLKSLFTEKINKTTSTASKPVHNNKPAKPLPPSRPRKPAPPSHFIQKTRFSWHFQLDHNQYPPFCLNNPILVHENVVVVACSNNADHTILFGIDALNGQLLWEYTTAFFHIRQRCLTNAYCAANGYVFVPSPSSNNPSENVINVLKINTGMNIAQIPLKHSSDITLHKMEDKILVVANGVVSYISYEDFNIENICELNGPYNPRLMRFFDNHLYSVANSKKLVVYNLKTGALVWSFSPQRDIFSDIHPAGDHVFLSLGGILFKVTVPEKNVKMWKLPYKKRILSIFPVYDKNYLAFGLGQKVFIHDHIYNSPVQTIEALPPILISDGFLYYLWDHRIQARHLDSGRVFSSPDLQLERLIFRDPYISQAQQMPYKINFFEQSIFLQNSFHLISITRP
jgi:outer membrane protein assembly factor BamB